MWRLFWLVVQATTLHSHFNQPGKPTHADSEPPSHPLCSRFGRYGQHRVHGDAQWMGPCPPSKGTPAPRAQAGQVLLGSLSVAVSSGNRFASVALGPPMAGLRVLGSAGLSPSPWPGCGATAANQPDVW